jgi:HEPN domain
MKNLNDITELADWRLEEADYLCKGGYFDGAFYLAGYAVELYLKAKIAENLDVIDFYSQYAPKSDLSKTFLIHNLERLVLLSGLQTKFNAAKGTDTILDDSWMIVSNWSEKSRYDIKGLHSENEVNEFINALNFIIKWIKMN